MFSVFGDAVIIANIIAFHAAYNQSLVCVLELVEFLDRLVGLESVSQNFPFVPVVEF